MKRGIGKSHSKIILIGEHSVVYGYPAIAIPLKKIEIECAIEEAKSNFFYDETDTLSVAIFTALKYLKKENVKIKYKITSQIPQKRGMGSSAAVSIAAIRAIFNYFGENLEDELLEKLVNTAEIVAHKTPSGLDAKTCLSDKAIRFVKNKGFSYIDLNLDAYLVIADTGIYGNTGEAIQNVKNLGSGWSQNFWWRFGRLCNCTCRKFGNYGKSKRWIYKMWGRKYLGGKNLIFKNLTKK